MLNKGEKPKFGHRDLPFHVSGMVAISTSCKYPELASKFLDFGYGQEGIMAYNFGIEGVSYNMIDGYPTYTDLILKNPDGLSVVQAMSQYMRASNTGPFVQQKEYVEQYYQLPQQQDALVVWKSDAEKYNLPRLTFTAEESSKMSKIQQNIEKYVQEYMLTTIMGKNSTDTFDSYLAQLEAYGLEEWLQLYNKALERYEQR